MIVSQFHDTRRFMGRLDPGQDLAGGFRVVCGENSVSCGWITAAAVVRNAVVQPIGSDGVVSDQMAVVPNAVFCPGLWGNVSLMGEGIEIRLYGACFQMEGEGAALKAFGLLRGGEVLSCEFVLIACDDMSLVREAGAAGGFASWMMVQSGRVERPPVPVQRGLEGPAPRPPPAPLRQESSEDDDMSDLLILDMKEGDYVEHPRFGQCRIVLAPQDDRLTIRLPGGKQVGLHLGVMRVLPAVFKDERKVFKVEIKRKP